MLTHKVVVDLLQLRSQDHHKVATGPAGKEKKVIFFKNKLSDKIYRKKNPLWPWPKKIVKKESISKQEQTVTLLIWSSSFSICVTVFIMKENVISPHFLLTPVTAWFQPKIIHWWYLNLFSLVVTVAAYSAALLCQECLNYVFWRSAWTARPEWEKSRKPLFLSSPWDS